MTDRELLERAAKAAGIVGKYDEGDEMTEAGILSNDAHDCLGCWNPLIDDGDALRLAVKLNLQRAVADGCGHIDSDGDIYAATRRAIVRAAAKN